MKKTVVVRSGIREGERCGVDRFIVEVCAVAFLLGEVLRVSFRHLFFSPPFFFFSGFLWKETRRGVGKERDKEMR